MKYLHLIRHSKSDWSDPNLEDLERPLSKRGKKNARSLGKYMREINFESDIAMISPSTRTRETFLILEKYRRVSKNTRFVEGVYEADHSELIKFIRTLASDFESAVLIGHNPGLETLADRLLFSDESKGSLFLKIPTSAFLSLAIDSEDWEDWGRIPCKLIRFWIP